VTQKFRQDEQDKTGLIKSGKSNDCNNPELEKTKLKQYLRNQTQFFYIKFSKK